MSSSRRATAPNYENQWWALIYDQMMHEDMSTLLDENLNFYRNNLANIEGTILECACGTGLIMLALLAEGHDVKGFDVSEYMLQALRAKPEAPDDIDNRISVQDLSTFQYDQQFDTIIVPTNSFSMIVTQEDQIKSLRNIRTHLAPDGMLLPDLRLAGPSSLVEGAIDGSWHTWSHPETGRPIRQRLVGTRDFRNQLVIDMCTIEYDGEVVEFPMTARWFFKEEFKLLLRVAGFALTACNGTADGDPLETGVTDSHSYWTAVCE